MYIGSLDNRKNRAVEDLFCTELASQRVNEGQFDHYWEDTFDFWEERKLGQEDIHEVIWRRILKFKLKYRHDPCFH